MGMAARATNKSGCPASRERASWNQGRRAVASLVYGGDAPGKEQPYGRDAGARLFHMCTLKRVTAKTVGEDRYGRPLARVTCGRPTPLRIRGIVTSSALQSAAGRRNMLCSAESVPNRRDWTEARKCRIELPIA